MNKIGFMQGRLSHNDDGKIQSFPKDNWENEFCEGKKLNFDLIEWTLDFEEIYKNPLMNKYGQKKILALSNKYLIEIPSLTGDCFMQNPFWKSNKNNKNYLEKLFVDVVNCSSSIGIRHIVVPLVDNGRISNKIEELHLKSFLTKNFELFRSKKVCILFESDFNPKKLKRFINDFPDDIFGINYDVGNSASLGFNPIEEINSYGNRIYNVHLKDREYRGNTVNFGDGDANFDLVFKYLKKISYEHNFIIQGARAEDKDHAKTLKFYKKFTLNFFNKYCF